jgi:hypothetical protein
MKIKKCLILFFFSQTILLFSQKIGIAESYNSNFKHAHLKGMFNMTIDKVEDLEYNIKPFIDSLLAQKNIDVAEISNIDWPLIDKFSAKYGNREIENYLYGLCEKENYDSIIIIKSFGNKDNKNNLLANDLYPELDYGIVSFENPKKSVFYYNNIIFLYYSKKDDKLQYPVLKRNENLFYDLNPIKFDEIVFDMETKKLVKTNRFKNQFLKDYKTRLLLNLDKIISQIKK